MLAFLSNLTNSGLGEIIGGILQGLGYGVGGYALGRGRASVNALTSEDFATKKELKDLEKKHDAFESEIRATLRESEQRTHARLDTLASKMDESIGLQKGVSIVIQSMLSHITNPTPLNHEHQK